MAASIERDPIVGIDLGTSNSSVAAVADDGQPVTFPDELGRRVIPSAVSFHPNGSVLVGEEAKQRRIIDPKNTVYSVKRILGRRYTAPEVSMCKQLSSYQIQEGPNEQPQVVTRAGKFAPAEISAIVLDHMRSMAMRTAGGECRRAVITVPANFNDAQRQATASAGAIAELVVMRILNEPTAAALAYGHGRSLNQTVAVYDFGGGTFDITILALRDNVYEVLATAGDTFLGGDDIDNRVVDAMVHVFLQQHRLDLRSDDTAMQRLRATAELCKMELSEKEASVAYIPEIAIGPGGKPLELNVSIPRDGFVKRISDIIEKSFPVCDEALRLAGLAVSQIDEVVLVGGTTRIPYLRGRVAKYFNRTPRVDVNPDIAVALGAALQGHALAAVLDKPAAPRAATANATTAVTGVTTPGPDRETLIGASPPQLPPVSASTPPAPAAIGRIAMKKVAVPRPKTLEQEITEVNPPPRPVLLDVTPRGLAVATVGGFCDEIIGRNSQLPIEQTRIFTIAKDGQTSVEVRVCQGESRKFDENILLGTIALTDIPARPRSETKIAVTFEINTDGMLEVRARDEASGKAQSARIEILGAQSDEEIGAARDRMKEMKKQ